MIDGMIACPNCQVVFVPRWKEFLPGLVLMRDEDFKVAYRVSHADVILFTGTCPFGHTVHMRGGRVSD